MKKLLIGILIAMAVIAAVVVIVFYLTSGVTEAADRFFALVRDGKAKEAYRSTAQEFRASTAEDQFLAFLKSSSIADFERASWHSRSVSNGVGDLEGSVTTKQKGVIPIKMKLVKEAGVWKVLSIDKAASGLIGESDTPKVPAELELAAMASNSVLLLGRAINAQDFGTFYRASARLWQGQTTPEALKTSFQPFIDKKLDLTIVAGKAPEFSQPAAIDDKGRLVLKGSYPLPSVKVAFTVSYIREDKQWSLVGINVSMDEVPPSGEGVMPPEDQLKELVHQAVTGLADAIARDDFADFHKSTSVRWQAQISVAEIRKAFSSFAEKKISLKIIEGKQPEFTAPPKLDGTGVLSLVGQYSTEPYRVLFELEFRSEASQWKLQAVNVRTKNP
jgi:hypothetical protein